MKSTKVSLVPLKAEDRNQFIIDNQRAFRYGATIGIEEKYDKSLEECEIISRETIEACIDSADCESYRIVLNGKNVGGVILKINKKTHHNHLELFFVSPEYHSQGIGFSAWQEVEALYSETQMWETCTPYFEKRNIHFYVNKCGFHIVEFYNEFNTAPNLPKYDEYSDEGPDEMFRFIKVMDK